MSLMPAQREVLVVTDDAPSALHSSLLERLRSLAPQRRVTRLNVGGIDAAAPDAVLLWLVAKAPPARLIEDASRTVLVCVVGGRLAAFDSALGTYAQMGL